jgi:hypothetical protein
MTIADSDFQSPVRSIIIILREINLSEVELLFEKCHIDKEVDSTPCGGVLEIPIRMTRKCKVFT